MKTLYLCGPIAGRTDIECQGWRKHVTSTWTGRVLDPMRRDYRSHSVFSPELAQKIVEDDLTDINQSDAMLVYFNHPSVGSSMEIFYAAQQGKPIVLVNARLGQPLSPWLVHHVSDVVLTISGALRLLDQYLS